MRLRALVCALFGILIAAPRGQAQFPRPTIGAGGGAAIPVGNLSTFDNTGYNVLVFAGIDPGVLPIGARIDGSYAHMSGKFGDARENLWSGTANLTYKIHVVPLVQPYFIGGVGYYRSDPGSGGLGPAANRFGANVGVGASVHIPLLFSVFGEFRYHYVFGPQSIQYVPLTVGIQI